MNVLVADDESAVRLVLARLLERRGHSVTVAADVAEALAHAAADRFDVALVDLGMPGNGRLLAERLSQDHGLEGRVLVMTGGAPDIGGPLPEGARVVAKPIDRRLVLQALEQAGLGS